MKIIDKIMESLSLYDEEDVFDEEPEAKNKAEAKAEEPKSRPSLFRKKEIGSTAVPAAAEDKPAPAREKKSVLSFKGPQGKSETDPTKMSKHTLNLPVANKLISVVVLEPVSFDDSQKIADYLRGSQPVVVNFTNTDNVIAKRMTDFISGTIYALGGSMKKLGRSVLVCAPKNVDIDAGVEIEETRGGKPWEK